jgi:hypothetical protein
MRSILRPIFAFALSALLVAIVVMPSDGAQRSAKASGGFDGLWSVAIVTLQGSCDPSYRYPVRIVGNRVVQADSDPNYQLYGAVGRSGAIRVIVSRGGQYADGSGRLSNDRGEGRWHSSSGQCSGQWTAVRRG